MYIIQNPPLMLGYHVDCLGILWELPWALPFGGVQSSWTHKTCSSHLCSATYWLWDLEHVKEKFVNVKQNMYRKRYQWCHPCCVVLLLTLKVLQATVWQREAWLITVTWFLHEGELCFRWVLQLSWKLPVSCSQVAPANIPVLHVHGWQELLDICFEKFLQS